MEPESDYSASWLVRVGQQRWLYHAGKRTFDLILATLLLILTAPIMLLITLLIRLDSPGPAVFHQERIRGKRHVYDGQEWWKIEPFTMYKFRTMYQNADTGLHREYMRAFIRNDRAAMNAIQGAETDVRKLVRDPRVTRIGQVLRKTSLDELPQLWNVVKGEMSLVGPRPPLPYEVQDYVPWHRERLQAVPGLTGWWQIAARDTAEFDEMVRLDIWYIEHQSLWLDLQILAKTPLMILMRKGGR